MVAPIIGGVIFLLENDADDDDDEDEEVADVLELDLNAEGFFITGAFTLEEEVVAILGGLALLVLPFLLGGLALLPRLFCAFDLPLDDDDADDDEVNAGEEDLHFRPEIAGAAPCGLGGFTKSVGSNCCCCCCCCCRLLDKSVSLVDLLAGFEALIWASDTGT
jgi:hypothetical protein